MGLTGYAIDRWCGPAEFYEKAVVQNIEGLQRSGIYEESNPQIIDQKPV